MCIRDRGSTAVESSGIYLEAIIARRANVTIANNTLVIIIKDGQSTSGSLCFGIRGLVYFLGGS